MTTSAVELSKHLGGINFPASKQDLIDHASEKNANQELMDILSQMPDQQYEDMADVEKGFSKVK